MQIDTVWNINNIDGADILTKKMSEFLIGYTITVFGVESTCKLTESNMKNKDEFPVIVDVVSSLPVLQVSTSLPKVRSRPPDPDAPQTAPVVTAVTLYAGQR